ncbi:MAG TPA: hypothetical protein VG272_00030, partial [Candidatus Acidoferrales bacterium]|nr:hypothetical protein [Candidatus Acidoferrales bacterium]
MIDERWRGCDWAAAAFLFLSTAAVVLWQNSRLAVLWDLSYILENSYRISLGQLPYRDFPFPYAPGTFLVQALLIKLTGRVFFHHVLYCAVIGGLGTVVTWRILLRVLREPTVKFRLIAFLLTLPITVLGIYSVFPHPFYDPDCTFVILLCVFFLFKLESKNFPAWPTFSAGIVFVVPIFVKQNTGLAFVAGVKWVILLFIVHGIWRKRRVAGYFWLLAGMTAGFSVALLALHFTVGLKNYWHWTIQFAASRRLPGIAEMFAPYMNPMLLLWIAAFAAGAWLLWYGNRRGKPMLSRSAVAFISVPFGWTIVYLFLDDDPSERAERLLALWPLVLLTSLFIALWNLKKGPTIARLLPFILIATVQGAFFSQQLWGSTYAIWPLLMILFAGILAEFFRAENTNAVSEVQWLAGIAALSMLVAGSFYVVNHERLDYSNVSDGDLSHPTRPELKGLSMRGDWVPQFEELVHFTDRAIPRNE